jgi:hypothetical protein
MPIPNHFADLVQQSRRIPARQRLGLLASFAQSHAATVDANGIAKVP